MLFLPLFDAPGADGTALDGEVDIDAEEVVELPKALGLSISTKDFRL